MCISPLPEGILSNLNKFQYKSTDDSLLYHKILSPCLNKVVNYLPTKLAPNLITLFSLLCNIFASIISYYDGGFDFSQPLKPSTCIIIGVFQFMYLLLDNIDGKQARRTGNSSPFGMLMDHGCDIFTNICTCFNVTKLLLLGNDDIYSFSAFFGLILGFYIMTYEEYIVGEMHFPPINGTDEGNLVISIMGVILAITGQDFLLIEISKSYRITIGKLIGIGLVFGGFSTIYNLYLHTYQKKGFKALLRIPIDTLPFYSCIIIPILFILYDIRFYKSYKWVILANSCFIFARVTLDTQIKISTMDKVKCNVMFIVSNLVYINAFLFIHIDFLRYYVLLFLFVAQVAEISILIFFRTREITNYLGIRVFCVKQAANI